MSTIKEPIQYNISGLKRVNKKTIDKLFTELSSKFKQIEVSLYVLNNNKGEWCNYIFDSIIPDSFPEITLLTQEREPIILSSDNMVQFFKNNSIKIWYYVDKYKRS